MLSSYYSIAHIHINFVKIILLKSDNCALTLRKRRFCDAKQPLLPCKTYAFGMQNNRFCNALVASELWNRYAAEKYLHTCDLLFACLHFLCNGSAMTVQRILQQCCRWLAVRLRCLCSKSAGVFAPTSGAPNESYSCFWKTFILCSFVAEMRNK